MFGFPRGEGREKKGVLAQRLAIPEAQHPRVPEPTAKSALADSGPREVASVGADAMALDALNVMAERDVSAVAVVSPAGLIGIFSERDHARKRLPANRTVRDTPVVEMMAEGIAVAAPADSVRHCLALMDERRATHVAVVDQQRLLGLLSQDRSAGGADRLSRTHFPRDRDGAEAAVPARNL